MDKELTEFLLDQFSKVATKDDLKSFATKDDLNNGLAGLRAEMHQGFNEIRSEMVTKGEFYAEIKLIKFDLGEIWETVKKLDWRTDEDVRAVIKDVDKIKKHLFKQGHKI